MLEACILPNDTQSSVIVPLKEQMKNLDIPKVETNVNYFSCFTFLDEKVGIGDIICV